MNVFASLLPVLLIDQLKIGNIEANTVVTINVGEQYSINCNSIGVSYQWRKQYSNGNGYYDLTYDPRYIGINSYTLTITNIQSTDAGTYQCTVTYNGGSTWSSSAVTLQVVIAINGNWTDWTSWSDCSMTCGSQTRTRLCNNPAPANGGSDCSGFGTESKNCITDSCPVYYTIGLTIILRCKNTTLGSSFEWMKHLYYLYDDYARISGSGTRELTITNAVLSDTSKYQCVVFSLTGEYLAHEAEINVIVLEAVSGIWETWSSWSACTKTCGGSGSRVRKRRCNDPPPSNSIQFCEGDTHKTNYQSDNDPTCADDITCSVNGNWGAWTSWSECSGTQTRTGQCTNPAPANGGSDCVGSGTESQTCYTGLPCNCPASISSLNDKSHGAIIGVLVGVVIVLLIALVVLIILYRRRTNENSSLKIVIKDNAQGSRHDYANDLVNEHVSYLKLDRISGGGNTGTETNYDELQISNDGIGKDDKDYYEINPETA